MRAHTIARTAGTLAGVGLATFAISSWQIARGAELPPTGVTLTTNATGELAVAPTGRVLEAPKLLVGAPRVGRFTIRNQTASELRVRLKATGPETGLDEAVRVEISVDGGRVAAAPLAALRRGVTLGRLRSTGQRAVQVRVTLDRSTPGVQAPLKLELSSKAVR